MKSELLDPAPPRPAPTNSWRSLLEHATQTLSTSNAVDESSSSQSASSSQPSESAAHPEDLAAPALDPLPRDGCIKHYEIIRELGQGGMGLVLLARDTKLARLVAIKLLHDGGKAAERMHAEARATARATHDNIVVIYEVGVFEGHPYMVLEYVEGRTLRQVISTSRRGDERTLPPGMTLTIMVSVVRALAAAHKSGIVHRDLKPANIMLRDSGQVKLLDFGIARPVDSHTPKRQAGTRVYMSPEQWSGGEVDERCDLWAAGLVFYELLAGAHPLAPITTEKLETIADLDTPMPSLSDVRPDLVEMSEVISRCLRKRKEERFNSADELLVALEACKTRRDSVAVNGDERPFAGLAAFQEADADRFFGRASDVAAVVGSLARQVLIAVAGPSGAGKSSFIRAGVIPAVKRSGESWDVLLVRPGRKPLSALREALAMTIAPTIVDGDFDSQPGLLGMLLRAHCRARGATHRALIFVDQFEELYTLVPNEMERAAFLASLLGAADDPSSPLRVIVATRSDFLDHIVGDSQFMAHVRAGLFFLPPLGNDRLREALTRPVEAAGYRFESEAMITEMLHELSAAKSPLPLLQFAAAQLWEARDQERKMLTRESYEKLGGVAGALATRADRVVAALSAPEQQICRAIFSRLVTPERTRAIVTKRELGTLTEDAAAMEAVIQHLCDARLLLLDTDGESGLARLELVHESLIERWPTLGRWLGENADDAQFFARVRAAASQWEASGEPSGLLWRDRAAEEVHAFYERNRRNGTEVRDARYGKLEERYLTAVMDLFERDRRRRRRLITGAFAFLGVVAIVVFFLALRAQNHAKRADIEAARVKEQNETLAFQALRGRNAMRMLAARKRQDDPTLVLALLREVESEDIPKEWSELVSPTFSQGVSNAVWVIPEAIAAYDAAISPDGERIVVAMHDGTVRILSAETLEVRAILRGHKAHVWKAAWSADGKRIVSASGDKTARLWSADGNADPLVLRGHEAEINSARMRPDGTLVVTASDDKTVRIFSAIDGKELAVLRHPVAVSWADFSPDGKLIVSAADDHLARVWSSDGTGEPLLLRGHTGAVIAAAFHPNGTSIATASIDRTVRVWDALNGSERLVLRGHEDKVNSVAWSPDGQRIASASKDKTARVWNADGSGSPIVLTGHRHWVYSARFSPNGRRLVTASLDYTVRTWNIDEVLAPITVQNGLGNIAGLAFSPNGKYLATFGSNTMVVWNADGTKRGLVPLDDHTKDWHFTWGPDGERIAIVSNQSNNKIIQVWKADGSDTGIVLEGHSDDIWGISWCAENDDIVTVSRDGMSRHWRSDGRLLAVAKITEPLDTRVLLRTDRSCRRALIVKDPSTRFMHAWNVSDGTEIVALGKHDAKISNAQWSPNGRSVLTGYEDSSIRIWDIDGAAPITFESTPPVWSARFSPDGDRVALACEDGKVRIWKADGTQELVVFGIPGNPLSGVWWSPDGARIMTSSSDRMARVWNADGSGVPFVLVGARTHINAAIWSPDGKSIAVHSDEPVARIWPDVRPFSGPDDSRLWRATSYCIPPATRIELLGVTDAEAREAEAACQRRVAEARAPLPGW